MRVLWHKRLHHVLAVRCCCISEGAESQEKHNHRQRHASYSWVKDETDEGKKAAAEDVAKAVPEKKKKTSKRWFIFPSWVSDPPIKVPFKC